MRRPLVCLGFIFDHSIIYMSDLDQIPQHTWDILTRSFDPTLNSTHKSSFTQRSEPPDLANLKVSSRHPKIAIIDCLYPLWQHPSHLNFPQALEVALRLNASMTYFTDFVHPTTHFMWEELCRSISGTPGDAERERHPDAVPAQAMVKRVWADTQLSGELGRKLHEWKGSVEPGWDGLVVEVHQEGCRVVEGERGTVRGW